MAKVSIGLRGWRFDEEDVFTPEGDVRPLDEMPADARERVLRLSALVGSPCDACWLIHGEENIEECNVAAVVYGEPLSEVVLCSTHEPEFLYWFREEGGSAYRGSGDLEDAFYEWFADGGRAPEGYGGLEHVETDPEDLPEIPDPEEVRATCDARAGTEESGDATGSTGSGGKTGSGESGGEAGSEETGDIPEDLDLGADYPTG
jgi:hypothetical protein